ncbi:MAG TPA: PQQ-binding-like beta-propeller repeat protein, partial [Bacteroidales bacterium]|nr:PQQ-binding-like beta-propeller repeat protein [Bacteroidales bacterium]
MKLLRFIPLFFFLISNSLLSQTGTNFDKNWPAWRGPLANGIAPESNPPVSWSEGSNIKWRTPIPGKGFATPVIWDNYIFISTAVAKEGKAGSEMKPYTFKVVALNRTDGKILWEKSVADEEVQDRIHQTASHISGSSVTDGRFLYAYFGSRGLFCLDFNGNIIWKRDFGLMQKKMNFGEGSSPALYDNKLVVLWDHEGQSMIFCVDKTTGKDLWQKERDEPSSWSTPLIINYDGKVQVITAASNKVRSYNLDNGNLIWECSGLTGNVIPSPVFGDGILYVMSGYRGNALMSIRLADAKGDISGSDAVVWSSNTGTPYVPSPLLVNNRLYFLRQNSGALSCLDALTGKAFYSTKMLEGMGVVYSSPVYASGRIYQPGGSGLTYTLKDSPALEILSENKLDDSFTASPAIAGDEIFLRGLKYLY